MLDEISYKLRKHSILLCRNGSLQPDIRQSGGLVRARPLALQGSRGGIGHQKADAFPLRHPGSGMA